MQKIIAFFTAIVAFFTSMFSTLRLKLIYPLNKEKYSLVFEDNFNGNELDRSKWDDYGVGTGRSGFISPSQVKVKNGNLIITQEYRTDGQFGEGWYVGGISTKQDFTRGYFECRCKCNKTTYDGYWSAFWLLSENSANPEISKGGVGGAEIDIVEAFVDKFGVPTAFNVIHAAGEKNGVKGPIGQTVAKTKMATLFTMYHTFALEWTENEYTFFIDGVRIASSNFYGGVLKLPAKVMLTLENSYHPPKDKNTTSEFKVDYVRVYQKK